jgi:lipopolysaccharide heptosyltransferase II
MTAPPQGSRIGRAKAATTKPVIDPARVLIVAPARVGDMVMAEPLTRLLRRLYPKAMIDMVAPPRVAALASFMPEVRAVLPAPFAQDELALLARWRLSRILRRENCDLAILLPNSVKSALVPFLAGIPKRVGYAREGRALFLTEARWLDRRRLLRQIDRFLALALPETATPPFDAPAPALRVPDRAIDQALESLGLERPAGKLLLLVPGAEHAPARRWPAAHFAALAKHHHATGGSVWLLGSAGDREATAAVQAASGGICLDFAGRTRLGEAVALIALADAVVSNDSGLMHVAAALGRPQVALYGPSDPVFSPPLNARAAMLRLGIDCSPCHQRQCPLGHHQCLVKLVPQQAIDALAALDRRA